MACHGIDRLIGPKLKVLIEKYEVLFYEDRTIAARASDGIIVELGMLWNKKDSQRIEAYLTDHPTPDTW